MTDTDPTTLPPPPNDDRLPPEAVRIGLVVVLGTIMAILDTTIVAVALDSLAKDFHTSISTIQWVTTGYLLALAVVIPISGWAVHRIGAKPVYIASLSIFTVGSILCGMAWSITALILFRVFQGIGGGMLLPVGQTITTQAAGPNRLNKMMALLGIPMLLGPILGPVLGGLIISNFSWRWIFYVNVPIAIVAIFASVKVLKPSPRDGGHRFDLFGFLLLSPGLAFLVYGLSQIGSAGTFGAGPALYFSVAGLALVAGFVVRSLYAPEPLMDMRLFKRRNFTVASICVFLTGVTLFGTMFLLPLYYQIVRGDSALVAGLLMAPQGIGAAVIMRYAAKTADRYGPRVIVSVGFTLMALGTLVYTQVSGTTSYVVLAVALFIRGIGLGMSMMPVVAASYMGLRHDEVPRATTAISIIRQVGGSIGVAVFAVVLSNQIASKFPRATGAGATLGSFSSSHLPQSIANKLAEAFGTSYWCSFAVIGVALIPTLFLPSNQAVNAEDPGSIELILE
jgi:EmrB/QacA subfamily drug resistance transporter